MVGVLASHGFVFDFVPSSKLVFYLDLPLSTLKVALNMGDFDYLGPFL
jgi:hypothetical protein